MTRVVRLALAALFLALHLPAGAAGPAIEIEEPWIREAPPHARALAGFMKLKNGSEAAVELIGASCDGFGSVMLHRTVMEGGMAKMIHQHTITVPAGETLSFEPGSYHLMLMKPKQPVKLGAHYRVVLKFADGTTREATFSVRKGGSMAMQQNMNHMHH